MARTFDGPLNAADIAWLKARYSVSYVERMKDLHGVKGKADSEDSQAKAEAKAREAQEKAAREAEEARLQAERDAAEANGQGQADEDLIGGGDEVFDIIGATEGEVKTWIEKASDEEKAAALATEQGRTDREPRKGVVGLLS